jgi:hypothetical protein
MKLIILISLFFLSINCLSDARETSFWFYGGMSIPEHQTNRINSDGLLTLLDSAGTIGTLVYPDKNPGYSLGFKLGIDLSENAIFYGGFSFIKFPKSRIMLMSQTTIDTLAIFELQNTIIPIAAGIKYYVLRTFGDFYADVSLVYNFISLAIDYEKYNPKVPLSALDTQSRIGFNAGFGIEIPVDIFTPFLEVNYSQMNYIARNANEPERNAINIILGFRF